MKKRLSIVLAALVGLSGCATEQSRSYSIQVHNTADRPVTIFLTKDGPPPEDGWASPEQLAIGVTESTKTPFVTIPPGKTADLPSISGKFDPETRAVLRVYDGKFSSLDQILAISSSSPLRCDVILHPGSNPLVVRPTSPLSVGSPE